MLAAPLVIVASFAYLLLLFAVAWVGDRRAQQGRSIIDNAWTYSLSMAVYCTAWTYFGSVGRAASGGVWFLPIYLGPTLAMVLAWMVVRKMIRIAKTYRITSIADFVASRYGKSPLLAGLVTLITVVGIVPYIALQLKAVSTGYALLTTPLGQIAPAVGDWWRDSTLYVALLLAGFTVVFGTRHLDATERHEGMVAAIAFESIVKLLAFMAVGTLVTWGMFGGPADLFERALAHPNIKSLLSLGQGKAFAYEQWFALTVLSMLSVIFLPRQFQVMVVENVNEQHLKRAVWAFPLYMLLINVFVLPIAVAGLLHFSSGKVNADSFVLSLPLAMDRPAAGTGGLHRWSVGRHRHGDRRGDRGIDDGLQRPCDAVAATHPAFQPSSRRRPHRRAAGHPARRDLRGAAARISLLPPRRRGLCAGQHRSDQLRGRGAVRAGDAGRHVLEGRYTRWRAGRSGARFRAVGVHADAAVYRQVRLVADRLCLERAVGHCASEARAVVRADRRSTA